MNNYLIVTDSTSAMDYEEANTLNIEMIPLNVIIDGQSYKDHIDISTEQFYDFIRQGKVPTTSQPSIGLVEQYFEKWKKENYDAIIILSVSSGLSGTYHSLCSAQKMVKLDNVHIIDTRTCGGALKALAISARQLADEGKDLQTILETIKYKMNHTFSFLYPKDFVQLKKGGRISPAAANVANLLKIKPLLYLAKEGMCVDKYALVRTEAKVFKLIVEKFKQMNIQEQTHRLYVLQADCVEKAHELVKILEEQFNHIQCEIIKLPSVLTGQGGLGCLAIQTEVK